MPHKIGNQRSDGSTSSVGSNQNRNHAISEPLVCLHYLTQSLCELAGTASTTTTSSSEEVEQAGSVNKRPASSSSSMTVASTPLLLSSSTATTTTTTSRMTCPTTSTAARYTDDTAAAGTAPKRRRKGDAEGVRYSPEQRTHLRESMSQAGSLLDDHPGGEYYYTNQHQQHTNSTSTLMMEEDDCSQLAGSLIPLLNSPTFSIHHKDDLSYSDSEASSPPQRVTTQVNRNDTVNNVVAKDLMQELVWERLEDDDDDADLSYGGESYGSSSQGLVVPNKMHSSSLAPTTSRSRTRLPASTPSRSSSLVGEVITVTEQDEPTSLTQTQTGLLTSRRPKMVDVDCRQVSEYSSSSNGNTMVEGMVSESSVGDSQRSSSDEEDDHDDCSTASQRSEDSGVVDRNVSRSSSSSCLQRRRRVVARQQQRSPVGQERCVPPSGSKKRKEQSSPSEKSNNGSLSPSRVHDSNRARTEEDNYFLFPMQHWTDSLSPTAVTMTTTKTADDGDRQESWSRQHKQHRHTKEASNIDNDTSILLDLTEDLKEIAIIAGKSSESLVANLFRTLCEE